jgi:hypothetical protein
MNRAYFFLNTTELASSPQLNLYEQIQHASCIRPMKNNFVRMKILKLFVIALILGGCHKESIINPLNSNDFYVSYNVGSGWTGWRYELGLNSKGTMTVYEKTCLPQISERKINYLLLKTDLDSIQQNLIKLKYIRLHDYGFGPDKPTDLPSSFFKYRLGIFSDSARIYVPDKDEVPSELSKTIGKINRLILKYDIH